MCWYPYRSISGLLAGDRQTVSQEKLARTIADLEGATHITPTHLAEAVQYRFKTE